MLVFSTKLYVKETLTDDVFIEKAVDWVKGGKNYRFGEFEWDDSEEFNVMSSDKKQKFTINKYEDAIIIHLENREEKVIWTSDFVLTNRNCKRILAAFLYNDAVDMSVKLPEQFNRPYLLKQIVAEGYGDIDQNICTNNTPVIITKENINIANDLIMGNVDYMMPVVYVSAAKDGVSVDADELAKDLAGVAHVLVEESYECTRILRDLTEGKNPYNGAVQIFYSLNITQRVLPKYYNNSNQFRNEVAYSVFKRLILSRIDDEFSWTKIRYNNLVKKSKDSMEISQICDDLLGEKEEIIKVGNLRIQELEDKLANLNAKLQICESRLNNKGTQSNLIAFDIQEMDLYEGEIKDMVIKILEKELKSMDADSNLKESRKYHVLKSIIQGNPKTEKGEQIRALLRDILNKDGSFNGVKRRQLNDLGFTVEEGGKHYKITFANDDRYMFTLAKTPSDFRSNLNTVTKAANKIFGYN
jgi:hypothetical protein